MIGIWKIQWQPTQYYSTGKGAARGGAEGAQAPPLAIRILMFIS